MSYLENYSTSTAADVKQNNFTALPSGKYIVTVSDFDAKEDLFPEQHKVSLELIVNDGEYKGRKMWFNTTLKPDLAQDIKDKQAINACMFSGANSIADHGNNIVNTFAASVGNLVEVNLVYKPNPKNADKPYTNVYVNKLIAKAGTF